MLNNEIRLNDLLSQQITFQELRELLARLGEFECAWTPATTIRQVAEATYTDPDVVGRLLAEIRKSDWKERSEPTANNDIGRIETIDAGEYLESDLPRQLRAISKLATMGLAIVILIYIALSIIRPGGR